METLQKYNGKKQKHNENGNTTANRNGIVTYQKQNTCKYQYNKRNDSAADSSKETVTETIT